MKNAVWIHHLSKAVLDPGQGTVVICTCIMHFIVMQSLFLIQY